MSGVVLLTGATGFIGARVARWILGETDHTAIALVRAEDGEAASHRLIREWWDQPELASAIGGRVQPLPGDISRVRLGLPDDVYAKLVQQVTHIVHAAADLRLDAPLNALRKTNVFGTANLLELARAAHRDHGLRRFSHLSTAYVAGNRAGAVPEDALTAEHGFASNYEQSKYEGELLVQAAKEELPASVFRPGMVVGDSRTGAVKTFNTLYYPLRLCLTGRLRVLPVDPAMRVNLVPVDYVAESVARLTFEPRAAGLTFHLAMPPESLPTAGELISFVREWAAEKLGVRLPRPLLLPMGPRAIRWCCHMLRAIAGERGDTLRAFAALAPYFAEHREFRRDNLDRLLGTCELNWRELLPPILEYAVYAGFLHRSGRTVHEQLLFRLSSPSRPVTYHDVIAGEIVPRPAAEVRREILRATGALRALGVGPGERVAVVGLNSTRYLALDAAIGLADAVSVPLYYTSPPAEIGEILRASGARALFVGAPRLLERLAEIDYQRPIVSFCRGPLPPSLHRRVLPWDEFLALGEGTDHPAPAAVAPADLATIRYTSGTTGPPKGVTFTQAQLRWMGETLCSLFPWAVRNRRATYLSYLPLNHVVEGILAMYSPYYMPAPVDIYFLEEFRDIQQALPKVRPTVLFSVTRFYEKLHEAVHRTRPGRYCLEGSNGPLKWALRPLVRWTLLRRAGLDRCTQLIVGSGHTSEELLRDLREIGVEVHNAYGLTEAPLVTINRLGRNRLGTVGELLPETEVRIAEDGEVMLRGPQVTPGYFDEGVRQPFHDGWLLTGDLGQLTEEGSLLLRGRKKEIIATSYGKKIHPAKVEAMLREIPGIAEAMLVGEGRPYCGALLWTRETESGHAGRHGAETLDRAVGEVNAQLSHPEQVKSWVLLRDDLSIEGGDLTANLKLRRSAIASRLRSVVDSLYGAPLPDAVLHLGRAGRDDPAELQDRLLLPTVMRKGWQSVGSPGRPASGRG
ncbi:MAG: SDR family oxidoreductase [Sphingomonadaceae bacterium]